MPSRRTLIIINPVAGAGRAAATWTTMARALPSCVGEFQAAFTECSGDAVRLASGASGTYGVVVAAGGDGTVSEVAEGLLSAGETQTALGIVPLGTGNDIARSLGIRGEKEGLAALAQPPHPMDAIRVKCVVDGTPKDRLALGFAAVGITGDLLRQTTRPVKRLFGQRLAYYIGLVRAIWCYRPARMRVACDESVWEERFLFVCAGNCERSGGGMRISPGARSDDGRLNVNLISSMERWETLRQLYLLRQGRHTTHPKVRYLTASSVAIDTDPAIEVAADGDLIGWTPARFGVQPKALKVFGGSASR